MLSFTFRRVLSHPGIFSMAQRLPTRAILSNQSFAMTFQRNLTTTASDRNSDSTADSKPESKSKPKSTRRKTGTSPKTAGKDKKKVKAVAKKRKKVVAKKRKPAVAKKKKKKAVTKPKKVTINPKNLPPKAPGGAYTHWMRDWISTQPKIENAKGAQETIKRGAQVWKTVSEDEKQQYREKAHGLLDEHHKRIAEWRENVNPAVVRELNRRRKAKGLPGIRGLRRPPTGYTRFFMRVQDEYPKTEESQQTRFKAAAGSASSQWRAMSDAEKAEYIDPARAEIAAWHEKYRAESQAKA